RSIAPVVGTPLLSVVPAASFLKSTWTPNCAIDPAARAWPWARSRHQAGSATAERSLGAAVGSCVRKATLKKALGAERLPAPPGWVLSEFCWGIRYLSFALSDRPTAAASHTVLPVGSHSECGTSPSIGRR